MWGQDYLSTIAELLTALAALLTAGAGLWLGLRKLTRDDKAANTPPVGLPVPDHFDYRAAWEKAEKEVEELEDMRMQLIREIHRLEIILTRNNITY